MAEIAHFRKCNVYFRYCGACEAADIPLPAARPRKRKARAEEDSTDSEDEHGRRKGSKSDSSKGLRQLTRQVCDKVKSKRSTTYREVANELVTEILTISTDEAPSGAESKTVRRRVYDALNVLMAMGIIAKDKKEIRWIGLPNAREELDSLQKERASREERLQQKRDQLKELEAQKKLYRNLAARNLQLERQIAEEEVANGGMGAGAGISEKISLPFLIIHTKAGTDISCEMTDDRTQYTFNFSKPFEINQEIQILREMDLPESHTDDETLWALSAGSHQGSGAGLPAHARLNSSEYYTRSHAR